MDTYTVIQGLYRLQYIFTDVANGRDCPPKKNDSISHLSKSPGNDKCLHSGDKALQRQLFNGSYDTCPLCAKEERL